MIVRVLSFDKMCVYYIRVQSGLWSYHSSIETMAWIEVENRKMLQQGTVPRVVARPAPWVQKWVEKNRWRFNCPISLRKFNGSGDKYLRYIEMSPEDV
jgi:hypothetical protein